MPNEKRDEEALCGAFIKSTQRVLYGEGVDKKKNGPSGILAHTNKEGIPFPLL